MKWQELILKGREIREKEILDFNKDEIPDNSEVSKKRRKEVIKRIEKEHRRNHSF